MAASLTKARAVLAGIKTTSVITHFSHQPVHSGYQRIFKQCIATQFRCLGINAEQLSIVVEHFFKVRNAPLAVLCIAKETAAEMIKNTSPCDLSQCRHHHFQSVFVCRFVAP